MSTAALSGNDTILLDQRVFADLADNDAATLNFPNDIASLNTGKNGNAIYGLNESGKQCEVQIRVIRGSEDDKWLNNRLTQQMANFAAHVLLKGKFIKKIGDGDGAVTSDTYIMSGGIFTKIPSAKSNVSGDAEQSIVVYTLKFANAPRALT